MTTHRAIILIGLVCFVSALGVDGSCLSCLFGGNSKANFDGLNKWLEETLPEDDDPQKNLAQVEANLDKLSGSKVKRAAELFVEYMEAQQCNKNLLSGFKEIINSGIHMEGSKRVERVMDSRLSTISHLCGRFIDKTVEDLYRTSLEWRVGRFLQVVVLDKNKLWGPIGASLGPDADTKKFFQYIRDRQNRDLDDDSQSWSYHLRELAKNDPKGVFREVKFNPAKASYELVQVRDNFKSMYNKYLMEPCVLLIDTLDDTFSYLYTLSQQDSNFVYMRSVAVKQLLYAFKQCRAMLSNDSYRISRHMW